MKICSWSLFYFISFLTAAPALAEAPKNTENYFKFRRELAEHCKQGIYQDHYTGSSNKKQSKQELNIHFECSRRVRFLMTVAASKASESKGQKVLWEYISNGVEAWFSRDAAIEQATAIEHYSSLVHRWPVLWMQLIGPMEARSLEEEQIAKEILSSYELSVSPTTGNAERTRYVARSQKSAELPSIELEYIKRESLPERVLIRRAQGSEWDFKRQSLSKLRSVDNRFFYPRMSDKANILRF